jgi:hypothetical protein
MQLSSRGVPVRDMYVWPTIAGILATKKNPRDRSVAKKNDMVDACIDTSFNTFRHVNDKNFDFNTKIKT